VNLDTPPFDPFESLDYDAIIVGGSAAGLSAALILGRARRRVLIADGGEPRNLCVRTSHGFLTRDGAPPAELRRIGREQLQPYGVVVRDVKVIDARKLAGGFEVTLQDSTQLTARKLLLATGVVDKLPAIEGLPALWGTGVLHCPYCHGWEVRDEPLAVLGRGKAGLELVELIYSWSRDLVLLSHGPAELGEDDQGYLRRIGVAVREERIARLEGEGGELRRIVFAGGEALERRALFLKPRQRQSSDLAERLGCALNGDGHLIRVNRWGHTTVPGVFAAGDATSLMQKVIVAAGEAAVAATMLNAELVREEHERWRHSEEIDPPAQNTVQHVLLPDLRRVGQTSDRG
jgi:thioredoxin reductase